MSVRNVRRILLLVRLGQLTFEEAEEELARRTTSLNRDLILFVLGLGLGLWIGALSMYHP